jgi:hypothetical protein
MRSIRQFTLVAAGLVAAGGTLAAQTTPVDPGSRVRIARPCADAAAASVVCAPLLGTLVSWSGDTILVRDGDGQEHTFRADQSVRVSVGRERRRTVLGLGIGAAAGLVAGFALAEGCKNDPGADDPELCNLGYLAVIPGAGLGALIGSRIRSTSWVSVPMGGTAVELGSGGPRTFTLGLRVLR